MRRQNDGQSGAGHAMWPVHGTMTHGGVSLHSSHYYRFQREFLKALARRIGFDLTAVSLRVHGLDAMPQEQRARVLRAVTDVARSQLRKTDQLFERFTEEGGFALLLPGTREEGAWKAVARLERAFASCGEALLSPVVLAFGLEPLYVRATAKA